MGKVRRHIVGLAIVLTVAACLVATAAYLQGQVPKFGFTERYDRVWTNPTDGSTNYEIRASYFDFNMKVGRELETRYPDVGFFINDYPSLSRDKPPSNTYSYEKLHVTVYDGVLNGPASTTYYKNPKPGMVTVSIIGAPPNAMDRFVRWLHGCFQGSKR